MQNITLNMTRWPLCRTWPVFPRDIPDVRK